MHGTPEQPIEEMIPELPGAIPQDEDPPLTPEARRAIQYINAIQAPDKRRALAETDLEGRDGTAWLGLTRGLDALDEKLETLTSDRDTLLKRKEDLMQVAPSSLDGEAAVRHSDELLRVTQEIARIDKQIRHRSQDARTMSDQEAYASQVADQATRTIEGNIELVLRAWGDIPVELQDAIMHEDQHTLQHYGVDSWSARLVALERAKIAQAEQALLQSHLGREVMRTLDTLPSPATLAQSLSTPEFAKFSRPVIEAVLQREGISNSDIGAGLQELALRYPKSAPAPAPQGSAVYEITPDGVKDALTGARVHLPESGPTPMDLTPRSYDDHQGTTTPPLIRAEGGKVLYDRREDPAYTEEKAALQALLRTGAPAPVSMPPVPELPPSVFTGTYAVTADGIVAIERKPDGTSTETPLNETHGHLGSVTTQSPEERFRVMHGLADEPESVPATPVTIIPVEEVRDVTPVEREIENPVSPEAPVIPEHPAGAERKDAYKTQVRTERGALISITPDMLFAEMSEDDEARFAEALGGKESAMLLLMEKQDDTTRLVRDISAATGGALYVGAYRNGELLCHAPLTHTPSLGATIFQGGRFGHVVEEIVTPEMQEEAQKQKLEREALDRAREEAYRFAVLAAREREIEEEREARARREHEEALRRKAEEEHRAMMEAQARALSASSPTPPVDAAPTPDNAAQEPSLQSPLPEGSPTPYDVAMEAAWKSAQEAGLSHPEEWQLVSESHETPMSSPAPLDETGTLFASFLEREYGIGLEESLSVPPSAPFEVNPEPSMSDMAVSPDSLPVEIAHGVARAFETRFGILESDLAVLPVFQHLSPAKQLLVLRNLEQLTLQQITQGAKDAESKEWEEKPWWQKGLAQLTRLGVAREARTKELEQGLLARARGASGSRKEGAALVAEKLAHIQALARVAESGKDAHIGANGRIEMDFVSKEDVAISGEASPATAEAIRAYNVAANNFARIPHAWQYQTTVLSPEERASYGQATEAYAIARATMLDAFAKQYAEDGVERPSERAMIAMNTLDEHVTMSQLFTEHPDAERALTEIEDASIWKSAAKEFWKTKGAFVAYGSLVRAGAVATAGALALPTMGASMAALGVATVSYAGAVGVGYGVGRAIGKQEGERLMKDRRVSGRLSGEDEREEVEFEVMKHGNPTGQIVRRKLREFTDANFFVDRIDRLTAKLDTATDPATRALLERKIAQTTTLAAAKLRQGMVNFGGSSSDASDTRKGDIIGNRLALMQAMHRGAMVTMVDETKMEAEFTRMLGARIAHIESSRRDTVKRIAVKAGLYRAAFAATGAVLAKNLFVSTPTPALPTEALSQPTPSLEEIVSPPPPPPAPPASPAPATPPAPPQPSGTPTTLPPVTPTPPLPQGNGMPGLGMPTPPAADVPPRAPGTPPPPRPPQFTSGIAGAYTSPIGRGATPMIGDPSRSLPPEVRSAPSVPPDSRGVPQEAPRPSAEADQARVVRAVTEYRVHIGRSLSGTEMVTVRNLEQWGTQTTDAGDQALLGAVKRELASAMKTKGAPLTPLEMYKILEQHGLSDKVAVPQDAELTAYRTGKTSTISN